MSRSKLPPVTGAQFAALRESSGLSREEAELQWKLNVGEARMIEEGISPVPKRLEALVAWNAAHEERTRVLAASGLLECAEHKRLATAFLAIDEDDADARLEQADVMEVHERSCPVCTARREYAAAHGPAIPDLVGGFTSRMLAMTAWFDDAPWPFRIPRGSRGDGRRIGALTAIALSTIPVVLSVVMLLATLLRHGFADRWWRDPLKLATLVPLAYLAGGFLTGWTYDLTRRVRFDLVRYVILGACGAFFVYGGVALVIPLLSPTESYADTGGFLELMTALGAIGGAGYWGYVRVKAVVGRRFAP